jgi:hypothetical protein
MPPPHLQWCAELLCQAVDQRLSHDQVIAVPASSTLTLQEPQQQQQPRQ